MTKEHNFGDIQNYQKVLFLPQARYETIYSPRIDFEYESSDIQIISREVHSDYVY